MTSPLRRWYPPLGVALWLALLLPGPAGAAAPRSGQLGVATIGGLHTLSPTDLARELDAVQASGARWIRVDVNWASIQAAGRHHWNWAPFDAVVRGARARNLRVLATIGYTPGWARPAGTPATHPPRRAKPFARFARAAANRYKRHGVHHWEVWNEPNIPQGWAGRPNPRAYAKLLVAASRALRAADRSAFVVTGGLAPAATRGKSIAPVRFLKGIYASGARWSFNAVGHHAYTFPFMPSKRAPWSAWRQMAWTTPNLRRVMKANRNRKKKIWVTEYGAPTGGDRAVPEARQAAMLTQAYTLWARYGWAGPLFWYSARDRGPATWHNTCGLVRANFSQKPAFHAYRAIANAAS